MIDPEGIAFVALTPTWWAAREAAILRQDAATCTAIVRHMTALAEGRKDAWRGWDSETLLDCVPQAVHCVSFIERRTTRPLVSTPAFSLQLFVAGLDEGLWTLPHPTAAGQARPVGAPDDAWRWARHPGTTPVVAYGTDAAGLEPIVACRTTHAALDSFLADQVTRYFAAGGPA
jgi:hypothetical protein